MSEVEYKDTSEFSHDLRVRCEMYLDALERPITTRHVGTIAFQGTDAQINEAMQKYFGGVK